MAQAVFSYAPRYTRELATFVITLVANTRTSSAGSAVYLGGARSIASHQETLADADPGTSTSHDGAEAPHKLPIRTLVAASVGNAVEWYDWTVYATFSIYFATQIFPSENESLAFIGTFATYALAFFFRPLGGMLLGRYADLRGRKQAMLLTILLMAGGSLVIAILPTFNQVGWLAPILLLLARIAQGMSLGGEVSNASAYLAEIAPPSRRGRYSSFFYISTGTAVLLASLLGALLASTLSDAPAGELGLAGPVLGRRLPSASSGCGCAAPWPRPSSSRRTRPRPRRSRTRCMLTLREHPTAVAQLIGFTLLSTLCYYTFFSALTPFAVKQQGLDDGMVFLALSIATALFVALQYPFGWTADRFGRKPQMLIWSGAIALLDRAALDADRARGGLRRRAAGVLLRARCSTRC